MYLFATSCARYFIHIIYFNLQNDSRRPMIIIQLRFWAPALCGYCASGEAVPWMYFAPQEARILGFWITLHISKWWDGQNSLYDLPNVRARKRQGCISSHICVALKGYFWLYCATLPLTEIYLRSDLSWDHQNTTR